MKILFISDLYPIKNEEINTPKTLFKFVRDWRILGHQVDVLKPNFLFNSFLRGKPFYKTGRYENAYNANYITPFLFDVKKKIPNYDYDIIISHLPSGIIFSNHFEGKKICAVHCSDIEVLTNPIYKFYFKTEMEKAYKNCSAIACRSEVLQNKFLKLYPQYGEKTFVASSGVDIEPNLPRKNDRKNFLTCANLIKRKNVDKLILAVNKVENVKLKVIGTGKELSYLKSIANENTTFLGHLQNDKVLEEMAKSDVFVLPSVNETFGMVYLEAMASGCITVGTKNDGIDGIIKDGINGFLSNPDVESLVEVITSITCLSEEQQSKMLQNCYNTANSYKSLACADRYLKNVLKFI